MKKTENKETRYFIDIDLKTRKLVHWDYDQRANLKDQKADTPEHHRIFLTKGQYNKLIKEIQQNN